MPYYQTLKEIPWPLKQEKLKNWQKTIDKSNFVSQKAFINFKNFNLRLIKQKTQKITKKTWKIAPFWAQKLLKMTF